MLANSIMSKNALLTAFWCGDYTPVGKKEQGRFGLYVATKALRYCKEYIGIDYPLPKMDLVAVADFAAGIFKNTFF